MEHDLAKFSSGNPTRTSSKLGWSELRGLSNWKVQHREWRNLVQQVYFLHCWNVFDGSGRLKRRQLHDLPDRHVLNRDGHDSWLHMHQLLDLLDWPVQRVQLQQLGQYRVWGLCSSYQSRPCIQVHVY